MVWEWTLIRKECTGCGICADVCPHHAIKMTPRMAYPESVPLKCVGCMICVEQCPFIAIEVAEVSSAATAKAAGMRPALPRATS